jgi:hypothetical protein
MATNACTRGRSGRYVAAKPILSSSIPHQEKPVSGSSSLWPKAPTLAEHRRTASAPVRWREGNRPGPCSHGPKAQARSGGRTLTRPSMEWPGRNLRGMVTTMALPGRGRAEAIARLLAPVEDRVREREGGSPPRGLGDRRRRCRQIRENFWRQGDFSSGAPVPQDVWTAPLTMARAHLCNAGLTLAVPRVGVRLRSVRQRQSGGADAVVVCASCAGAFTSAGALRKVNQILRQTPIGGWGYTA